MPSISKGGMNGVRTLRSLSLFTIFAGVGYVLERNNPSAHHEGTGELPPKLINVHVTFESTYSFQRVSEPKLSLKILEEGLDRGIPPLASITMLEPQ